MKIPEYPIKKVDESSIRKFEQAPNVPIIDIIRHGESNRKEERPSQHKPIDTSASDFELDSEHLDLSTEGIKTIRESINQLVVSMDKSSEVVLLVASPSWRTHSALLVAEDQLRKLGVQILAETPDPKLSSSVHHAGYIYNKIHNTWFDEEGESTVSPEKIEKFRKLSKIIPHINEAEEEILSVNFNRFLRHLNNIYSWLKPETIQKLEGKKLRIICFTHQEVTTDMLNQVFPDMRIGQAKGQILEIRPKSKLGAGKKAITDVKLYPTQGRPDEKSEQVVRGFNPED